MQGLATLLAIILATAGGIYLLVKIIRALARRQYGVDILALLAIVACLLAGEYYAAAIIVIMMLTGELLERYAGRRARRELSKLLDRKPKTVHLADGRDQPAAKVKIGSRLLVKTGEMVLIDGLLHAEAATLDTANITGESLPRELTRGEPVISGSLNVGPPFELQTTTDLGHSQFSRLADVVAELEQQPAHFVRLADRYALPFTAVSLLIAAIAWAASGDFTRFAEVLVLASPCPLILAAPIAFISGISRAFGAGILVKNGSNLERLANVRSAAFDKTGTLSSGQLTVSTVTSFSRRTSRRQILALAAALEQGSTHPLAQAIVRAAPHAAPLKNLQIEQETAGLGILARRGRQRYLLGSAQLLEQYQIPLQVPRGQAVAKSAVYLARNRRLLGRIDFSDELHANAARAVRELKRLGLRNLALVTGDNPAAAQAVAQTLGLQTVFANQLPTDKLQAVKELQPKPTLFVGDGLNDAPVLAAADVGIAMGAFGSPLAVESAGVVIMTDDISKVPFAIRLARATRRTATRSVLLGLAACLALMLVAAFGLIPATIGALLQEAIDALSITSALTGKKVK